MVRVAVLGGFGHVGQTIVEALKQDSNHSVSIFSRQLPTTPDPDASTVVIDYQNQQSLVAVLNQYEIHTVISCLGVHDQQLAEAEAAVIRACAQATCTKRFIVSNWSVPNAQALEILTPWATFQQKGIELLRTTKLEWTEIGNGYFLDYWGMPHIKTHLTPMIPVIDIEGKIAAIPGTGDEPIAFSYSLDVAKAVARLLGATKWDETTYIIGDKITWNEFLQLAQEARGTSFEVHHDDLAKLEKGEITELPNHLTAYPFFPKQQLHWLYAQLEMLMARGHFDLPLEKSVTRSWPDFKMLTVKEMLAQTWATKQE